MMRVIRPESGEESEGFFDLLWIVMLESGEESERFFDLLRVLRLEDRLLYPIEVRPLASLLIRKGPITSPTSALKVLTDLSEPEAGEDLVSFLRLGTKTSPGREFF